MSYNDKIKKRKEKMNTLIEESTMRKKYLEDLIPSESDPKRREKFMKETAKLEERIQKTKEALSAISQSSEADALRPKIKWLWAGVISLAVLVVVAVVGIYLVYNNASLFRQNYHGEMETSEALREEKDALETEISLLSDEISSLKKEITTLDEEIEKYEKEAEEYETKLDELNTAIETLEKEKKAVSQKAEWLDDACRIVVADEGSMYKTYHTYDCEKWEDYSYWIYNKEQIEGKAGYTKCTDCN